jgi:hypothetical protein
MFHALSVKCLCCSLWRGDEMRVEAHTAAEFAKVLDALLPPGEAWRWAEGGTGHALLLATAQEPARLEAQVQAVLDDAILAHRVVDGSWRLVDYRRVADESQSAVHEVLPRAAFVAGSPAGARLWSDAGAIFLVPNVKVEMCRPFVAGSPAGSRVWGSRARYALLVSYYATVTDVFALRLALGAFKQAHMALFFIDITQSGGEFLDA